MDEQGIRVKEKQNWSVLVFLSLASFANGMYRDGFAALFPFLQSEFDLSRAQLGFHPTFVFIPNMIGGLFSGHLIDMKGAKWGLFMGTTFLGIIMLLHAIVPNFLVILLLASFAGILISINMPAANKGISEWFPREKRSTAIGIMSTGVPIGALVAATSLPAIAIMIGWRTTILIPGTFALVCALLIFTFYSDKENDQSKKQQLEKGNTSLKHNVKKMVKNTDLMVISFLGFFLGAASGTVSAHFTLFLYLDHGFTESFAGIGFAAVQIGSIFGRPGWGVICDRLLNTNKRKGFLYIGFLFTGLTFIFGLLFKNYNPSFLLLMVLAFLVGFSARGWHALYFASVNETVSEDNIGVAIGFSLFFTRGGIMLFPPIFGLIADYMGFYDTSWILLGLLIFIASIAQYYYYLFHSGKTHSHEGSG